MPEDKKSIERRDQDCVVQQQVTPDNEEEAGTWVDVYNEDGKTLRFDGLAACDRWIKNHGDEGEIYRPARVCPAVKIVTETKPVRSVQSL